MFLQFLKSLLAGLIYSILFSLLRWIELVADVPLAILRCIKNISLYAREVRETGRILTFIKKTSSALIQFALELVLIYLVLLLVLNPILLYAFIPYFIGFNLFVLGLNFLRGVHKVWNEGMQAAYLSCLVKCLVIFLKFKQAINLNIESYPRNATLTVPRNTGTQQATLQLSDAELATLKERQSAPLNVEEKAKLSRVTDQRIAHLFTQYNDLEQRLNIRECTITTESLTEENAVLLVKLYLCEGQWRPVPNSSFVYDKMALLGWFSVHNTHPTTRENITSPNWYENSETRYVQYPYYANADLTSGVSQELSEMIVVLREYLSQNQKPVATASSNEANMRRRAFIREKRDRFFSNNDAAKSDDAVSNEQGASFSEVI